MRGKDLLDFSSKFLAVLGYVDVLLGSKSSGLLLLWLFFKDPRRRLPKQELLVSFLSLTRVDVRSLEAFGVVDGSSTDFCRLGTSPKY